MLCLEQIVVGLHCHVGSLSPSFLIQYSISSIAAVVAKRVMKLKAASHHEQLVRKLCKKCNSAVRCLLLGESKQNRLERQSFLFTRVFRADWWIFWTTTSLIHDFVQFKDHHSLVGNMRRIVLATGWDQLLPGGSGIPGLRPSVTIGKSESRIYWEGEILVFCVYDP